jgi:hypothetical protein
MTPQTKLIRKVPRSPRSMMAEPVPRLKRSGLERAPGVDHVVGSHPLQEGAAGREVMIRKLASGYRIYSRKKNPKTGKRRNLGTFRTRKAAEKHEREIQYFKRS